jgi:hypothetical protein
MGTKYIYPTRAHAQEWSPLHCTVHVREVEHLSYRAVRLVYETEMHLMSKMSSELAGMPGSAFEPYASFAGIVRRRSLPACMPATPTSQPLMTSPTPSLNEKGLPFLLAMIQSASVRYNQTGACHSPSNCFPFFSLPM